MTYTVLGASGFIGRNLAAAFDRSIKPRRAALYSLSHKQNYGTVFYCLGDDTGAIEPNLGYLLWFLKHCQFESLVYLSSTRVYLGAATGTERSELRLNPSDLGYQFNVIKLAAEAACLADERCKVVRLSTVIGTQGNYLIPELIRSARNGAMNLYLPFHFERDFITLEDVIELLPKIVTGKHKLYNLASGVNFKMHSIAAAIQYITKAEIIWHPCKESAMFPQISIERIGTEFTFEPRPVLPAIQELCK